jgi:hypothetical protein
MRETTLLKRELSQGEHGRGKRYSADLRRRVRDWAMGRRQDGVSWTELSSEVGLGQDTVRRWCVEPTVRKGGRSLLPVKVVQQPSVETHCAATCSCSPTVAGRRARFWSGMARGYVFFDRFSSFF